MKTYTHLKEFKDYDKMISNLSNMPVERLQTNINIYQAFLNSKKKFFIGKNKESKMDRNCVMELVELFTDFVKNKTEKDNIQTIANESKKNYINDTNKTKPPINNGDKTMNSTNTQTTTKTTKITLNKENLTMNKIAKIAPIAVKKILATQIVNKTDTKKTYWGGWGKVMRGMNAAFRDYENFEILENEWLDLRVKLGGKNSPLFHYCWKLINNNRVGVKQEPNSTLRFIKNAKIRIAMAKDVLANSEKYKNEISENWKKTFGTEI